MLQMPAVKTPPTIALVLVVSAALGLVSPVLATSVACTEDGGTDCCGLDCALCLCCSHTPPTALTVLDRRAGAELDGSLRPEELATPREPLPRDVLHVPRSTPVS